MKRAWNFVALISLFLGIGFGLPRKQLTSGGRERPAAPASAQTGGTQ
jgi:hypothetical protein